ncbi:IS5 family transposase [Microvirga sp. M2]|uniref:IS5 family transposase n=1 Tax=Microvirga sp. M2 TaxID=3073270 RepID=UPI0039C38270
MGVKRYELSEAQWRRIAPLLPGKVGDPGRSGADNRLFVNGVLWVLRSGAFWQHLPERYGKWKSVHARFTRWTKAGVWEQVFAELIKDRDNHYLMLDTTLVRVHQQAAAGKGGPATQALGRSRGGLTTKIHMICDGLGRPLRFLLSAGQRHDCLGAKALLDGFQARSVLADRAYDTNELRQTIAAMGAEAVIPSSRSRKQPIAHDATAYKLRNRIERCFNKLKHCRRFATRYDRRACHFLAFIHLAAIMLWLC